MLRLTIYAIGDKVIIPTVSKTRSGYYLETEPVSVIRLSDLSLTEVLQDALRRGNPTIPTPSRANYPKPVVLKYAGVNAWNKFAAAAQSWNLTERDGKYFLAPSKSDAESVYWGTKEKLVIPVDQDTGQPDAKLIIDTIASHIKSRENK